MCGIAGSWGHADRNFVRRMMERMIHRGPDAAGMHDSSDGVLGHRRLSIMDVAGGDQPIYSADSGRAIRANGEIYNFPQLRDQLQADGHKFRIGNDSESALHLYEDLAEQAAGELDGMFALAITDGKNLYLARDTVGIKPLYYAETDRGMTFASELKALVGCGRRVREFPPGTWYHTQLGFHRFGHIPRRQAK